MPTEPAHYPDVERPVIAMAKEFAANAQTGRHSHTRGQLIHAIEGLMVATTDVGTWVVPSGFALWVPPRIRHNVVMHGTVSMRTVYVRPREAASLPTVLQVVAVTPLLQAALVALSAEPPAYDEARRGGHLAALILDEIARAPATPFALPIPADPRLAKLAQALVEDPGMSLDIDGWADEIGVSRRTLTRSFRTQTGISFGMWRRRLRLLRALELSAGGTPLARAAARVGYRSLPAFRVMAKKEFGPGFEELLGSRRPIRGSGN